MELIQDPAKMQEVMKNYGIYYNFNKYSGRNTMILTFETMIRFGKPFQMARGYNEWRDKFNRNVKKGQTAMHILKPQKKLISKEVDEETGEEIKHYQHYYTTVPVFEFCQTEGEPIPRPTKNHLYKSEKDLKVMDFIEVVNNLGISVEFEELLQADGYTNGERIVLGEHNTDIANICILFHELAHFNLHYENGEELNLYKKEEEAPRLKELEAETVSFMVSSALGISNERSKVYIANWNKHYADVNEQFEKRSHKLLMEALNQIDLFIGLIDA